MLSPVIRSNLLSGSNADADPRKADHAQTYLIKRIGRFGQEGSQNIHGRFEIGKGIAVKPGHPEQTLVIVDTVDAAVTTDFALPFATAESGQAVLFAERTYDRSVDNLSITVRSNPVLVTVYAETP